MDLCSDISTPSVLTLPSNNVWSVSLRMQEEQEAKNSVTEKGMDGFFSNLLTNNIAMGGDVKKAAISAYTPVVRCRR